MAMYCLTKCKPMAKKPQVEKNRNDSILSGEYFCIYLLMIPILNADEQNNKIWYSSVKALIMYAICQNSDVRIPYCAIMSSVDFGIW